MKNLFFFLLAASFPFFQGCGKNNSTDSAVVPPQKMLAEPEGTYVALLFPSNRELSELNGKVTISKFGDEFKVHIKLNSGAPDIHVQGLYSGDSCETEKTYGQLIIPFDGDLSARELGGEFYPQGEDYEYERSTSYDLMISDLPPKQRDLQLDGRVVLLKGEACGILKSTFLETVDDTPDIPTTRVGPKPVVQRPSPEIQVDPEPAPRTFWRRVRDRLGRWWRWVRGG